MTSDLVRIGPNFKAAIQKLEPPLSPGEESNTTAVISSIITKAINSYNSSYGNGSVGREGNGLVNSEQPSVPTSVPTGLIYGKIQSGKTRSMILSTALALDNHFRIVVVLTSNNNRLVSQTHMDFRNGLPGALIYSKSTLSRSTDLIMEAAHVKQTLENDSSTGVVIIGSKGSTVLRQIIEFLNRIDAKRYPAIIFDDEGDQATLDTNTARRSRGEMVEPSTIYSLVHSEEVSSLRTVLPMSIFLSVTGTPNSLFLQNADERTRPSFVELINPGTEYVGGKDFFPSADANDNQLVTLISETEKIELLEEPVTPLGLKQAIAYFLVAATMAGLEKGWSEFKLLCHPSVKQEDHKQVKEMIAGFVAEILSAVQDPEANGSDEVVTLLRQQYEKIQAIKSHDIGFDAILAELHGKLHIRTVHTINGNTTHDELSYSPYYNFLVGGNSIGRGIAIRNLLVTYYVRETKQAMMDTMYQHARMFGYRKKYLDYTQVFIPPQLYDRFYEITKSDEELRAYIDESTNAPDTLLIRAHGGIGLKPTRSNVIDATHTKVLLPGRQLYPDVPISDPDIASVTLERVYNTIREIVPSFDSSNRDAAQQGVNISIEDAVKLVKLIKTKSKNKWQDKQIPDILMTLKQQLGNSVRLCYRTAPRRAAGANGELPVGVLGGEAVSISADRNIPTLWLIEISGSKSYNWQGTPFIYPTIVFPRSMKPLIFNQM